MMHQERVTFPEVSECFTELTLLPDNRARLVVSAPGYYMRRTFDDADEARAHRAKLIDRTIARWFV